MSFPTTLQAARLRQEWAWREIYRDLSPVLLRYLRARGALEPEDLMADVFLQVVRKLSGFDGQEQEFRAWVLTIAHHRLVDELRRRARRPVELASGEILANRGPSGNAEEDALRSLAVERVRAIIARLSPDQQDVLFLRILGGLTVPEVSGVLGKTTGAVKALQARGVAAIKREISREAVSL